MTPKVNPSMLFGNSSWMEKFAVKLGVTFPTINRWENGRVKPSKLAKAQFDSFCAKMVRQGKLKLSGGKNE